MKNTRMVRSEATGNYLVLQDGGRRKSEPAEDQLAELRARSSAQDAALADLNGKLEAEQARLRQLGFLVDEGGQGYMDLPTPYWQAS